MQYWYDQQIRRYLLQFSRVFNSFAYKAGNSDLIKVPVRYGDMSRMVAHILRKNSENAMNSAPFMTFHIQTMQPARDRMQEPRLVSTVSTTERQFDQANSKYTEEVGNTYTIKRYMPVPYNLNIQLDMWTSNTEQKLQLMEQILVLFNPAIELQSTENVFDWTSITVLELIDIQWSSRGVPQGVDTGLDISSLTFQLPIWINPPAKVQKSQIIKNIISRVTQTDNMEELNFDPNIESFFDPFEKSGTVITSPHNAEISVTGNSVALLNANGVNEGMSWKKFLQQYGELHEGSSRLILRQSGSHEDESEDVYGTVAFNPSNDNFLTFTIDSDTLPNNTISAVDKIIDPHESYPGKNLDVSMTGQRYLLVDSIPNGTAAWGASFSAKANDIIEYNGTDWVISFDSSNTDVVQYVTNQTSMSQYKWTGTTWIDSFQGQYKPGFWKLELDAS
tara:strand:+ start:7263 stop:8606 length:1344 start_codon:yes stop_codon:yes gene_type:complete